MKKLLIVVILLIVASTAYAYSTHKIYLLANCREIVIDRDDTLHLWAKGVDSEGHKVSYLWSDTRAGGDFYPDRISSCVTYRLGRITPREVRIMIMATCDSSPSTSASKTFVIPVRFLGPHVPNWSRLDDN